MGFVEGLEQAWTTRSRTRADLLVVACAGYSDRALYFIDERGAAAPRPAGRGAVLGLAERVRAAVSSRRARTTSWSCPSRRPRRELPASRSRSGSRCRRRSRASTAAPPRPRAATGELICVLGPKGGTGKTLTASNLAVSARGGRPARRCSSTWICSSATSASRSGSMPERTIYDLASRAGRSTPRSSTAYLATHSRARARCSRRSGRTRPSAVTVEFLREVYAMLRSTHDYVIVDTPPGFTPEVIASIDSSSHVCMVGTLDSLSLKNTKLGLETLELMGYDPSAVRWCSTGRTAAWASRDEDVVAIIGRRPDVLVPSHRDIAALDQQRRADRAVAAASEAAKAFKALAETFAAERARTGEQAAPAPRRGVLQEEGADGSAREALARRPVATAAADAATRSPSSRTASTWP